MRKALIAALGAAVALAGCEAPAAPPPPSPSPPVADAPTPQPTPTPGIPAARFQAAVALLKKQKCTVEPQDPNFPMMMNVTLPPEMAMELTERQAKELALSVRKTLGEDAIVTIKSPGGQTLATASLWGAN